MTEMTTSRQTGWVADDSTFGARLALVRQRMGWGNVKEAAVACGLPAESWRRWERDGRSPRNVVEIAEIIADRTGCDMTWLVMGRRSSEGRTVVVAGETRRSTTVANHTAAKRPHLTGHPKPFAPHDSTRRPVRLSPVTA